MRTLYGHGIVLVILVSVHFLNVTAAWAHCDGLDGPVVTAARHALEAEDVDRVLIWVRAEDEAEIRAAFSQTLSVRQLGPEAQALADRYFFETLVRIHREGEGAPYTGLKPAGRDLGPAIPAADRAIEMGSDEALAQLLTGEMVDGLRTHFQKVMASSAFPPGDVSAGREYIEAYVSFIHYVESVHESATRASEGHYPETQ
jgi:hypothetical protein